MFTAALAAINLRDWYTCTNEWIKIMWHIHTRGDYSATFKQDDKVAHYAPKGSY